MRWWVIAAAALVVLAWWWRKQAKAALDGTARTVTAPPEAGTQGVVASLMAPLFPSVPAFGVPARQLAPAAQPGAEGVSTFAEAYAVNSTKPTSEPLPAAAGKPAPKPTTTTCPPGTKRAYQGARPICVPK